MLAQTYNQTHAPSTIITPTHPEGDTERERDWQLYTKHQKCSIVKTI